jgi:putative DNA methylase
MTLEAQRLGLDSYASDLNPVAVLINKAMIEIPPRFSGRTPVGPTFKKNQQEIWDQAWPGTTCIAEDIRRYGNWINDEAISHIGKYYPKVKITSQKVDEEATVIAWIWARTVKSPNPAYASVDVPLVSTFVLSSKPGKEAYIKPIISGDNYTFEIIKGYIPNEAHLGTTAGKRSGFICLMSSTPIDYNYIRKEGAAGRIGSCLMAIVAEGQSGRLYLSPSPEQEKTAKNIQAEWRPNSETFGKCRVNVGLYGLTTWDKLFTERQLKTLSTFSDLIISSHLKIKNDAISIGMQDDGVQFDDGGSGATAYADAIVTYLSFCLDKMADLGNSLVRWEPVAQCPRQLFGRQAIPMIWDFAEANPFSGSSGSWSTFINGVSKAFEKVFLTKPGSYIGVAEQSDAQNQIISKDKIISTDPPYYDNIEYADLSDFFYVWLRRNLRAVYPKLFATLSVPKSEELVATPYRHGSKINAEKFFLDGMTEAMRGLSTQSHPAFPITIYYAFKQSETTDIGTGNTGWETFIEAVISAGLAITGTWPMRTENGSRMISQGKNALASSIVLVCQKREVNAVVISRREFLQELKTELDDAVDAMIGGKGNISPVAPVDLAQAVIGPGMAIFSKYSSVLESDGNKMSVHDALTLINRTLTEGKDEYDSNTLFCLSWFEQYSWGKAEFGQADVLARAKGTNIDNVSSSGVINSGSGEVRLLKPSEYNTIWDPTKDTNIPSWELLHRLSASLEAGGIESASALLSRVDPLKSSPAPVRKLAYQLYTLCERGGKAEDARRYNNLILAWDAISQKAVALGRAGSQIDLFYES